MRILILLILLLCTNPASAQQVILLCTKTPSGTSCVPVDATHPLPVGIN